jgi:CDP-paratose 2-epimerase
MAIALVTGSAGLVGAETVRFFSGRGLEVVGIDNNLRQVFFGPEASTDWSRQQLQADLPEYIHFENDIRDASALEGIFSRFGRNIVVVIHAAAQPSHDWAAKVPQVDFAVTAQGTLNLLEATRRHCPEAVFIYTSTNKVYGDRPNALPLVEQETRWELDPSHPFAQHGIDETMSIDQSLHSLFGVSKVAADLLVQEYGRYFELRTGCFRGGCLTGPGHAGTQLHGFLAYLAKCALEDISYEILGYKGKQVRDNIHSSDLVHAFWHFFQQPRIAEVYNIGGGRFSNCSILEAIPICERLVGRPMRWSLNQHHRVGDHQWWISDTRKFQQHYPGWRQRYEIEDILAQIHAGLVERAGKR